MRSTSPTSQPNAFANCHICSSLGCAAERLSAYTASVSSITTMLAGDESSDLPKPVDTRSITSSSYADASCCSASSAWKVAFLPRDLAPAFLHPDSVQMPLCSRLKA
ncbi:MAG: hypothetical protein DI536_06550 [Archangium gephyra]|uniref:Uncharacterized protein n=1 Tax=Archangium gephyra TaxID=48 RepID=A0A2W5TWU8_9BACT|nr:MAG: hypothetical protein DI536_06550 [Archangium gephyra]